MHTSTRKHRLVRNIALALTFGAIAAPAAQGEPIDRLVDCYVRHQLGYMAGPSCGQDGRLISTSPLAPAAAEAVGSDRFDLVDAGIGAAVGAASIVALAALGGGAISYRRRHRPARA